MISARDVAARALGELLRRQPMSDAKVRFAWRSCVGVSIARATAVRFDKSSGTLVVITDAEAWRQEVHRSIPVVSTRMNELLGRGTVKKITVEQRNQPWKSR